MLLDKLKSDIPASVVVFLVALPLCLGIALASGAPLMSGIISGIIGGIVVGLISSSQTSVSGPAAGLAASVLAAIAQLGGNFELFLTAVFLAGVLQVAMGLLKMGFIANYIPSNVIKGLLASIGILIILKQLPYAVGYEQKDNSDFSFFHEDGQTTLSILVDMFDHITLGSLVISALSILILILWDKSPLKRVKFFPASLFVVILGVLLNQLFASTLPDLYIDSAHLVKLPDLKGYELSSFFHIPDVADFSNLKVYTVALTIGVLASLETLLNIEAIEKIDDKRRKSPPNRELLAQGVGNMTAGLLGGLPLTSVIVRSSVNINAGNKTKLSAILHGVLMLVSMIALVPIMNLIPLASLAAILIITGYKLAKASLFIEMFKKGWYQFIPFLVTILAIVFIDLLQGVFIGLAVSIFYLLRTNFRNPFTIGKEKLSIGEVLKLELSEEVSFLNKASIKDTLWQSPAGSKVLIDATQSTFIDEDVLEVLSDFKNTIAPEKNIQLNIIGLRDKYNLKDYSQFTTVLDKKTHANLTPPQILEVLKAGNERFAKGEMSHKIYRQQLTAAVANENPMAVVISCIDARTAPEIVFDASLGDLIVIRIAGNVSDSVVVASVELAIVSANAKFILVMGHSNCGTIEMAVQNITNRDIGYITSKIEKAVAQCGCKQEDINNRVPAAMEKINRLNAQQTLTDILHSSSKLRELYERKEIGVAAAYYDMKTGIVHFEEHLQLAASTDSDDDDYLRR